MEEQNLPNCHFLIDGDMLDIKSEKIRDADEAEKIKVTVITSQGEDSDTSVRVFRLENGFEDRVKNFIGKYLDEMFEISQRMFGGNVWNITKNLQENYARR